MTDKASSKWYQLLALCSIIAAALNSPCACFALGDSGDMPRVLEAADKTFPQRDLTLPQCFDLADANNKEILVAAANIPIARAAIVIARAIPNPTFDLIYGWGPAWEYIIAGNNQQFGWLEEIQVAGRRTKKINVARANYLQVALQVEAVRFDVHNRMRRMFAELAAAHAYADLTEAQREIAQKFLDIAQKRYDAGKAPGSEVLQARLAVNQFDTQRNQAQGRIVQDSAQMAQLLGEIPRQEEMIDVTENALFKLSAARNVLVPDPDRNIPPIEQLLPSAWHERNDLKAAIQQAYAARKAITLAKTQRIPDPVVGFDYLFSTYKPFQLRFFDPTGLPTNAGNKVPYQSGYLLTVQEETPIFYQYQGQINQAKANWIEQLKQNDQLRVSIATGIVSAYEALLVTRANIKKYQEEILPAGARVAQMARRGYQLGKTDLATAMLAQQQYQQLRSAYFDAVVAYQNAWADMERAVGVPLKL